MKGQKGFAVGYALFALALLSLVATASAGMLSGLRNQSAHAQALGSAIKIIDSSDQLRAKLTKIKDESPAFFDPFADSGFVKSATSSFAQFETPLLAAAESATGWAINHGDALTVPVSGVSKPVALLIVSDSVCSFLNPRLISGADPVLSKSGNGTGTTYSVTNTDFNGGRAADRFCVPGAGGSGKGLLLVGL